MGTSEAEDRKGKEAGAGRKKKLRRVRDKEAWREQALTRQCMHTYSPEWRGSRAEAVLSWGVEQRRIVWELKELQK